MFGSSSRVSTTTLTGTLPGGGSSPAPYGRRPSLVIRGSPAASRSRRPDRTAPGSGATSAVSADFDRLAQRIRIAGIEAAQCGPGDLPVLRGVAGDHRLAAGPGLRERVAERLQAGGEVDGAAARPGLAQVVLIDPPEEVQPRDSAPVRAARPRGSAVTRTRTDVIAVAVDGGEQLGEPLVHLLVGREQHRAQDGRLRGRLAGTESGRDRVRAHHDPASRRRHDAGDALGHGGARHDEHVGPAGGQPHHRGLPPDRGAQRRVEAGCLVVGQEVQGVAQQRPPLAARADEADVVDRDPAGAPDRLDHLPPQQPGWTDVPRRRR